VPSLSGESSNISDTSTLLLHIAIIIRTSRFIWFRHKLCRIPIHLHSIHYINRILSQICPRGVLEVKKAGRNKVLAEMCSYEAANRLVFNKFLLTHKFKAFVPMHQILPTDVVRDVFQDISMNLLKESISSPVKILEIHRFNRRVKIKNKFKYLLLLPVLNFWVNFCLNSFTFLIVGILSFPMSPRLVFVLPTFA